MNNEITDFNDKPVTTCSGKLESCVCVCVFTLFFGRRKKIGSEFSAVVRAFSVFMPNGGGEGMASTKRNGGEVDRGVSAVSFSNNSVN